MRRFFGIVILLVLFSAPLLASVGFGGWNDFSFFLSSKENNNYAINTVRGWFYADFSPAFSLYLRGKHQYVKLLNAGTSTGASSQSIIDLDLAYLRYKSDSLTLTLGRGYYLLGKGVVFNGIADGLNVSLDLGRFRLEGFGNYTGLLVADSNPYNFSQQDVNEGAKRLFTGLTARLLPSSVFSFYASGLLQKDMGEEISRYDSLYFLVGLEVAWAPRLRSALEVIYQHGEGPSSSDRSDIRALAAVFSSKWLFFNKQDSGFYLDIAYASGSANRATVYPNALTDDKTDKQFYSFGVYSTGFAFEPDLANLFYASLGFRFRPFAQGLFQDSVLRFDFSWYRKVDEDAPVSDMDAINGADLGMAFDLQYSWRIVSDVSFALTAGVFKPGNAFSDRDLQFLGSSTLNIAF